MKRKLQHIECPSSVEPKAKRVAREVAQNVSMKNQSVEEHGKASFENLCVDEIAVIFSYLNNREQYEGPMFVNRLCYETVINHCQQPDLNSTIALTTALDNQDYVSFRRYREKGCYIADSDLLIHYPPPKLHPKFTLDLYEEFKRRAPFGFEIEASSSWCWYTHSTVRKIFRLLCAVRRPDLVDDMMKGNDIMERYYRMRVDPHELLSDGIDAAWDSLDIDTILVIVNHELFVFGKHMCNYASSIPEGDSATILDMMRKYFSHPKISGARAEEHVCKLLRSAIRKHMDDIVLEVIESTSIKSDGKPLYPLSVHEYQSLMGFVLEKYCKDHTPGWKGYISLFKWMKNKLEGGGIWIEPGDIMKLIYAGHGDLAKSLMESCDHISAKPFIESYHHIPSEKKESMIRSCKAILLLGSDNEDEDDDSDDLVTTFENCFGVYEIRNRHKYDDWNDLFISKAKATKRYAVSRGSNYKLRTRDSKSRRATAKRE